MARSIATIKEQIRQEKNNHPSISGFLFFEEGGSRTGIANLWAYITAVVMAIQEQLLDLKITDIESKIAKAGAGTLPWLRDRILEFQTGYNVTYSNGVVSYATIDTDKQILTRCSLKQAGNRIVTAKVAKSDPPEALSSTEKSELEYYIKQIGFAGTDILVVSETSDKMYLECNVYYDGQFASSIQGDVEDALNTFLENLSSAENFGGILKYTDVVDAIQAVSGVKDVLVNELSARANATAFADRSIVYKLSTGVNNRQYEATSGYLVEETTSGQGFSSKITYVLA